MVIGLSFIATPVKFQAPSLERIPAIDVGRVTFGLFNKIELGMAAVMILLALFSGFRLWRWAVALIVAGLVVAQGFWLMPGLEERSLAIIAGENPPPSSDHQLYGILEITKVAVLIGTALLLGRRGRR